jgi:membrane protein
MGMDADAARPYLREEGVDRGRGAQRPGELPARGWKDVAARVGQQSREDGVVLLAAGVAFFALLALVPTLFALVSIYGLVADPVDIERTIDDALSAAPSEVRDLVRSQLSAIVESEPSGLGLGAVGGVALALWSASSGVKHLLTAVNLAYDEQEGRGFLQLRALSLALALAGIAAAAISVGVFVVLPGNLGSSGAEGVARTALLIVRWPLLAGVALVALAALYRWGPDRADPQWHWASPGAIFATVVWLVASVGFSIYTANFERYNETYGALGAVIVLLLWLLITGFVVIVGAELNSELERQTAVDSTTGPPAPLGERGAHAADTVGPPSD